MTLQSILIIQTNHFNMKEKKFWVIECDVASNIWCYWSVENMYSGSMAHWTTEKNHAMIFKSKKLAEEAFGFNGRKSRVAGLTDIDIKENRAFHEKCRKEKLDRENWQNEQTERVAREQNAWDEANAKEQERIKNLCCPMPFCASKNIERRQERKSNGVIGSGYHSNIVSDYYICQECGLHFSDVKKVTLGPRPHGAHGSSTLKELMATLDVSKRWE